MYTAPLHIEPQTGLAKDDLTWDTYGVQKSATMFIHFHLATIVASCSRRHNVSSLIHWIDLSMVGPRLTNNQLATTIAWRFNGKSIVESMVGKLTTMLQSHHATTWVSTVGPLPMVDPLLGRHAKSPKQLFRHATSPESTAERHGGQAMFGYGQLIAKDWGCGFLFVKNSG